ncbi:MAG: tol-pal system protein YbgF [Gammaproteobacteria bacterium]|nr:MAG: tol-pal system protein YbgF [Gammaproteobacteria bacterium]
MWATRPVLLICLLVAGANASAVSKGELETRIKQLERKLDSRSLVDLLEQVSSLQSEVRQLRGDIEVQTHNMESLQKRQRDLYLDIDRRLHRLEVGGVQQPATGTDDGGAPAAAVPVPKAAGGAAAQSAGTAAAASALNPADQRKDYDRALDQLKEGRYNEASSAFKAFLEKYPGSSYADNAQYWLGEVFYVTRQFKPALNEFGKVLSNYPDSIKVADAKLKMGYIQYELKDWTRAQELLNQVVKGYPGTTTARLAQERLDRMKRENRSN